MNDLSRALLAIADKSATVETTALLRAAADYIERLQRAASGQVDLLPSEQAIASRVLEVVGWEPKPRFRIDPTSGELL